jgi:hypothetical protein
VFCFPATGSGTTRYVTIDQVYKPFLLYGYEQPTPARSSCPVFVPLLSLNPLVKYARITNRHHHHPNGFREYQCQRSKSTFRWSCDSELIEMHMAARNTNGRPASLLQVSRFIFNNGNDTDAVRFIRLLSSSGQSVRLHCAMPTCCDPEDDESTSPIAFMCTEADHHG